MKRMKFGDNGRGFNLGTKTDRVAVIHYRTASNAVKAINKSKLINDMRGIDVSREKSTVTLFFDGWSVGERQCYMDWFKGLGFGAF